MEKDRGFKVMAIVALLIGVLGLSIAYAAYSQTLTINASGTVNKATWDVHFENLSTGATTGKAEVADAGKLTLDATTIQGSLGTLKAPGDSLTYTFDIKNAGSIDAKIGSIKVNSTEVSGESIVQPVCTKNGDGGGSVDCPSTIKYTLSETPAKGEVLTAGATKKLTLKLDWPSSSKEEINDAITISLSPITIEYVQN